MLNTLEAFAWLAAAALILKALDYRVPFAHYFEPYKNHPVEAVKPDLPVEEGKAPAKSGFESYWEGLNRE